MPKITQCQFCSLSLLRTPTLCVAGDPACSNTEKICASCLRQGKHTMLKPYCKTCQKTKTMFQSEQQKKQPVNLVVKVYGHHAERFLAKIASIKSASQDEEIYHIQGEKKYRFLFGDDSFSPTVPQGYPLALYCIDCCDDQSPVVKQIAHYQQIVLTQLRKTKATILALHPDDCYADTSVWRATVNSAQCMTSHFRHVQHTCSAVHTTLEDAALMRNLLAHLIKVAHGERKNVLFDFVGLAEESE